MKRFLVCIVLLFACVIQPSTAVAQEPSGEITIVDCGTATVSNQSHQFGRYGWLEYIVVTQRSLVLCPILVQAEGWVIGIGGSGLVKAGVFAATARRQVPVPAWGRYQTNGRHWVIWALVAYMPAPSTVSFADVEPQPEPDPDPEYECILEGGLWDWDWNSCHIPNCPLIVDTARDGYRLTSVANGVRFDLNVDGVPEQVAWTKRDSDEAFLAVDRNGNGRIDNGSELFGNFTPAYADRADVTASNGFEALKFAEGPSYGPSRADRQIDARDAIFSRLLLWRDVNHNGISEPDELQPASESGIAAIGTEYKNKKRTDRHGNQFRQRSTILWNDGRSDDIFDIWLMWRE